MSNEQKIEGTIVYILKKESGESKSGKTWEKQDFVVETEGQYPKKVCFTLFGDKISLLDKFSEGNSVCVSYNIESRDSNGRWFHNVTAWKIESVGKSSSSASYTSENFKDSQQESVVEPEDDSLPF